MPRAAVLRSPQVLISTLGALVGLVVAVVLFRAYGTGEVAYGPRGYTVESDTLVRVQFEVDKDPGTTALCRVRSRGRDGAEVGSAVVPVGPSAQRRQVVTYDLTTTSRGSTGEVSGCTADGSVPPSP